MCGFLQNAVTVHSERNLSAKIRFARETNMLKVFNHENFLSPEMC